MLAVNPIDRLSLGGATLRRKEWRGSIEKPETQNTSRKPRIQEREDKMTLGACWQTHSSQLLKNDIQLLEGTSLAVLELPKPFITEVFGAQ